MIDPIKQRIVDSVIPACADDFTEREISVLTQTIAARLQKIPIAELKNRYVWIMVETTLINFVDALLPNMGELAFFYLVSTFTEKVKRFDVEQAVRNSLPPPV